MASECDQSLHNGAKHKFLRMDVIEMTLLLKSIGFRLNSIDFDELSMSDTKSNENDNTSESDINSHSINVRITCSKSKIVSNLSYKYAEQSDAEKATPRTGTVCTCPKRESFNNNNNSFWEVQSSGTFANRRKSVGALILTPDNNTSSNLLPVLSTKSIALTQALIQVLLYQYKHSTQLGELSVKDVDIKSIMTAVENDKTARKSFGSENGSSLTKENLNSMTPSNSMISYPTEHDANVIGPKVLVNGHAVDDFSARNTVLNETINTEAFTSPKSSSSPNENERSGHIVERDANIINNLNEARNSIDRALLFMKLNVTRNLTHEASPTILTVTPNMHDGNHRMYVERMQTSQPSTGQNSTSSTQSTRSALTRRASIGPPTARMNSIQSGRMNSPKAAAERRASLSKLSLVRRAVSGISNRTIGSLSATPATTSKVPIQSASKINMKARPSSLSTSISRRITGRPTATVPNTTSTSSSSGLAARKTSITARSVAQVSKLAKK